jgi:peptide/nickel transport system permease protein
MARFLIRRVVTGLALALVVSFLVFAGTQLLPGDAASAILGRTATKAALAAMRAQLGLDRPVAAQYVDWLTRFVRGDLGVSLATREPVASFISSRVGNTFALALVTMVIMVPLSLTLGAWSGIRSGRAVDHAVSMSTLAFIALPEFVSGTILAVVFAVSLGLLPAVSLVAPGQSPFLQPALLVLPTVTLLLAGMAFNVRMVRAGVIEAMAAECVQMARLNGIPERVVISRYVLRNALGPTIQVLALTAQWLVGGVVVTETIFEYPGVGQGLVQAVAARDIPVVQSLALLIALLYIGINIAADLIVVLLVPRLRTSLS